MRTVIYGSRPDGHARVVAELLAPTAELRLEGLIDDFAENAGHKIGRLRVLGGQADLPRLVQSGIQAAVLGFGAAKGRAAIVELLGGAGFALPTLVHPDARVAPSAQLGAGCQVMPGAILGAGVALGRGVLVNSGAIVEHDARIGDGVVLDPGAVLAGRVAVGTETEIGSGAVIVPDIRIGARSVVGAGAAVIRHVADDTTVVGVPARRLERPSA